jgi:hypothetical protein
MASSLERVLRLASSMPHGKDGKFVTPAGARGKRSVGPSNADKIKNAAVMFGKGSKQHAAAQKRFGGPPKMKETTPGAGKGGPPKAPSSSTNRVGSGITKQFKDGSRVERKGDMFVSHKANGKRKLHTTQQGAEDHLQGKTAYDSIRPIKKSAQSQTQKSMMADVHRKQIVDKFNRATAKKMSSEGTPNHKPGGSVAPDRLKKMSPTQLDAEHAHAKSQHDSQVWGTNYSKAKVSHALRRMKKIEDEASRRGHKLKKSKGPEYIPHYK